jgi:5-methylcytosine-specific restriction endonuclease McrA
MVKGEPRQYLRGHNPTTPFSKNPLPDRTEKPCTVCGSTYPTTVEFFRSWAHSRDGLTAQCRECLKRISRERPVDKESQRAAGKRYRERNRERVRESQRRYYENNHERVLQTKRTHYEANREAWVTYVRNRRALQRSAEGTHTLAEVRKMLDDQGGVCAYCECEIGDSYQVDHMVPLSRGGRNDWTNLAVVCEWCNNSKNAKTTEEFFEAS